MVYFADVTPKYDRERIFRRLHIEPDTNAYQYAQSVFPSLAEIARQQLCMTHCYSVDENEPPVGVPEVDRCKYRITCLSTCSENITREISQMLAQGDFLEGYILNDLVNELLFNASDQMNRQISAAMEEKGCHLTQRFSPGERELGLEYQSSLLSAFHNIPAVSHVRLTESYMLYPEKSMLYLFGADRSNPEISVEHDCGKCSNTSCFFRSTEGPAACL
ncbi:hypothetical protein [uncultured Pseudoflavonifractor sp.]|uniref:hypothetical protein n=1 Tax=uncultured Pseudoflavonifractor sp. TaxID=1221379 RepID=UPI0025F0066F|nr:hypothetical protein [uncultured Pseudoflavonifractor sp.]